MNSRIGATCLLGLAISVIAAGCRTTVLDAAAPEAMVAAAVQSQPLAECARPDVVLGATVQSSPVDRASAQKASGAIGVRGDADIALLTTVTLGTRSGTAPSPGEAFVDGRGVAIVDRPAWVFVFRNQSVHPPSAGGYVPGVPRSSPRQLSALASIIDAQTGQFLRGWGCTLAN